MPNKTVEQQLAEFEESAKKRIKELESKLAASEDRNSELETELRDALKKIPAPKLSRAEDTKAKVLLGAIVGRIAKWEKYNPARLSGILRLAPFARLTRPFEDLVKTPQFKAIEADAFLDLFLSGLCALANLEDFWAPKKPVSKRDAALIGAWMRNAREGVFSFPKPKPKAKLSDQAQKAVDKAVAMSMLKKFHGRDGIKFDFNSQNVPTAARLDVVDVVKPFPDGFSLSQDDIKALLAAKIEVSFNSRSGQANVVSITKQGKLRFAPK